jgi:hypothetical protein
MRTKNTRAVSRAGAAAAAILATGALVGQTPAVAATESANGKTFDFKESSYILTMRAGAVEPYAMIPRDLPTDIGFSYVDLIHDTGRNEGRCETWGAGYWLGTELEEGVLGLGAAPPDAGDVSGGYRNPTTSRQVRPDLTPPGAPTGSDRTPALPAAGAGGPLWKATCDSDTKGSGTGNELDASGARAVGSTTSAEVDKTTGAYTGTSRAYISGIEAAGKLATINSLMQVKELPNEKPTVSYRISFFESEAGQSVTGFNQNSFTVSGNDVPVEDLVTQFNEQVKGGSGALSALGPLGFSLLAPQVGKTTDGGRISITAPVIQGNAGLHLRDGTVGQEQGVRFGAVTFSGSYGSYDGQS